MAKKTKVVAEVATEKRGRGRQVGWSKFTKGQKRTIASYVRKHGLLKGIELLLSEKEIQVSQATASKIASEAGVVLQAGRQVGWSKFTEEQKATIAKYVEEHGLVAGVDKLAEDEEILVSAPTASKIAKEYGVKLNRGRPAAV